MFDITQSMRSDLPAAAGRWSGFPPYNFVGGHNDADHTPVDALIEAVSEVLRREGRNLATYGLQSGPQGYRPLRERLAANLNARAAMSCSADDVLLTSGSLQALDLVNQVMLEAGDTVVLEDVCYAGTMTRLERLGVDHVGVPLDQDGMRMDSLADTLARLRDEGRRVKFIYTIPTVQNPSGTVMPRQRRLEMLELARRFDTAIFEDDCYADLTFDGSRPPAIRALDSDRRVIYCGSFSKSIAPALRVGYIVADWPVLSRLLAVKTDAGSGALEQMTLAAWTAEAFDAHVRALQATLAEKCALLMEAVDREFGAAADYARPKGGIFLWVTLPDTVDTSKLAVAAAAEGVAINPGAEWSANPQRGRRRMRLCFAHPDKHQIADGVARLAAICHREFGVPVRSGNLERQARLG